MQFNLILKLIICKVNQISLIEAFFFSDEERVKLWAAIGYQAIIFGKRFNETGQLADYTTRSQLSKAKSDQIESWSNALKSR